MADRDMDRKNVAGKKQDEQRGGQDRQGNPQGKNQPDKGGQGGKKQDR